MTTSHYDFSAWAQSITTYVNI